MSVSHTQKICDLFERELSIVVPDVTTDLIEDGLLDSLVFVELIVQLERAFEVEIPVAELEFEQFRTIAGITEFLQTLRVDESASGQESAA